MITITLRLSESLLSIFRDSGTPKEETKTIIYRTEKGITVKEILTDQGINPLLVPMVVLDTEAGNNKIDKDTLLEKDSVLTLYGPLAGG
jgi:hypothetical protein